MKFLNSALWAVVVIVIAVLITHPQALAFLDTKTVQEASVTTPSPIKGVACRVSTPNVIRRTASVNIPKATTVGKTDLSIFGDQPLRPTKGSVETTVGEVWGDVKVANDSRKGYALIQEVSPGTPILFDQSTGFAWKVACLNRIAPYEEQPVADEEPAPAPVQRAVYQTRTAYYDSPEPVQALAPEPEYYQESAPVGLFVNIGRFFGVRGCQQDNYYRHDNYRSNCNRSGNQRWDCHQQPVQRPICQPRTPPRPVACPPHLICRPQPICQPRPVCPPQPVCRLQQGGSHGGGRQGGGRRGGN